MKAYLKRFVNIYANEKPATASPSLELSRAGVLLDPLSNPLPLLVTAFRAFVCRIATIQL
jgi:hypothetical protein